MTSLEDGHARLMKTLDDGFAKVLALIDALIEEQRGTEVTPRVYSNSDEATQEDDTSGADEAEIKTEEATGPLEEVHCSSTREVVLVHVIISEDFERDLHSNNEVQNNMEIEELMVVIGNHSLVEEYHSKVDLSGWISNALNLFDKMHKKYYYLGKATVTWPFGAMGGHGMSERITTIAGKKIGKRGYSVRVILVFDPGGSKFDFSSMSTLRTRWKFRRAVLISPE